MKRFRRDAASSGPPNGNGNGAKAVVSVAAFDAGTAAGPEAAVIEETLEATVDSALSGTSESETGEDGMPSNPIAMQKFIAALMRGLQDRDAKVAALEGQLVQAAEDHGTQAAAIEGRFIREIREREETIARLTEQFSYERDEQIAALQEQFERERREMQWGLGSRVGVGVSAILDSAESAATLLRSQTEEASQQIVAGAEAKAENLVSEAEATAERIRSHVEAEAAAFKAKMRQVVGEVAQAHKSLGELAASLAHLDEARPTKKATRSPARERRMDGAGIEPETADVPA